VLVAYDFGDTAAPALAWALQHASERGARLVVVHVLAVVAPAVAPDGMVASPIPTAGDVRNAANRLASVVSDGAEGVPVEVEVLVGTSAGERIVEWARDNTPDAIVLGTHARGAFARAVLGSTADYVLRHADGPVITVRQVRSERA